MDARKKEYNFRPQTGVKRQTTSSNIRKETSQNLAKNSTTHTTMSTRGAAGGTTGGATGGASASGGATLLDTSTTSSTSDVSLLESSDQPTAAAAVPPELLSFMKEMKNLFRNFSSQVNTKLDSVVNEISSIKTDLESTKKAVSDLETSVSFTSDRLDAVENDALPNLREYMDNKITELNELLTLSEIHDRKYNLLVYGVPHNKVMNVF